MSDFDLFGGIVESDTGSAPSAAEPAASRVLDGRVDALLSSGNLSVLTDDHRRHIVVNDVFPRVEPDMPVRLYPNPGGETAWRLTDPAWLITHESADIEPVTYGGAVQFLAHGVSSDGDHLVGEAFGRPARLHRDRLLPDLSRHGRLPLARLAGQRLGAWIIDPTVHPIEVSCVAITLPTTFDFGHAFHPWTADFQPGLFLLALAALAERHAVLPTHVIRTSDTEIWLRLYGLRVSCHWSSFTWSGEPQTDLVPGMRLAARIWVDFERGAVHATLRAPSDERWEQLKDALPIGTLQPVRTQRLVLGEPICRIEDYDPPVWGVIPLEELTHGDDRRGIPRAIRGAPSDPYEAMVIGYDDVRLRIVLSYAATQQSIWSSWRPAVGDLLPTRLYPTGAGTFATWAIGRSVLLDEALAERCDLVGANWLWLRVSVSEPETELIEFDEVVATRPGTFERRGEVWAVRLAADEEATLDNTWLERYGEPVEGASTVVRLAGCRLARARGRVWVRPCRDFAVGEQVRARIIRTFRDGFLVAVDGYTSYIYKGAFVPEDFEPTGPIGRMFDFAVIRWQPERRRLFLRRVQDTEPPLSDEDGAHTFDAAMPVVGDRRTAVVRSDRGRILAEIDGHVARMDPAEAARCRTATPLSAGEPIDVEVLARYAPHATNQGEPSLLVGWPLDDDPWAGVEDILQPGARLSARAVTVSPAGAVFAITADIYTFIDRQGLWTFSGGIAAGDALELVVERIVPQRRRVSTSVSLDALQRRWAASGSPLAEGAVVEGVVKSVVDFGVFVWLAHRVSGLVRPRELAWARWRGWEPQLLIRYVEGQSIPVKILQIDPARQHVSLSVRQAQYPHIGAVVRRLPIGEHIEVEILTDGSGGLVGWIEPSVVAELAELEVVDPPVRAGEVLEARVLAHRPFTVAIVAPDRVPPGFEPKPIVDTEAREEDARAREAWMLGVTTLEEGTVVEGEVENVLDYGAFVRLVPDVVGLLHVSEVAWGPSERRSPESVAHYTVGQRVAVRITRIDRARQRIELSAKRVRDIDWDAVVARIPSGTRLRAAVISGDEADAGVLWCAVEPRLSGVLDLDPDGSPPVGESLDVEVIGHDAERELLKLALIEPEDRPGAGARPADRPDALAVSDPPLDAYPRPRVSAASAGDWQIFIAYAGPDRAAANTLYDHLAQRARVFLDHHSLDAGEHWPTLIPGAVERAPIVVVLISDRSVDAVYQQDEVTQAIALYRESSATRRVVPVYLEPVEERRIPYGLRGFQKLSVDQLGGLGAAAEKLLATLERLPPIPAFTGPDARSLSLELQQTYDEREAAERDGQDTESADQRIREITRALRDGPTLQPGELLGDGRYLLIEQRGRGGYASVWRAFDRRARAEVAIKVLRSEHPGDALARRRFERGADQLMRLEHPGIVRGLSPAHQESGFVFFAMEYVAGGNLRDAVLADRLPIGAVLDVIVAIGEAAEALHQQQLIHRDIKPSNILLAPDGTARLGDFDLVRDPRAPETASDARFGTFIYAAPEQQVDPRSVGPSADVYSLAMCAIFCCLGATLPLTIMRSPEAVLDRLPIGASAREVLERAISWEPEDRIPTMRAFLDALGAATLAPDDLDDTPR